MNLRLLNGMNAFLVVLVLFTFLNIFDAVLSFGGQAVDLPPLKFYLYSCWVAIRNVVGHTLLATSLVFILGRYSRWILIPLFVICVFIESAAVYTWYVFHASLGEIWIELVRNTSFSEIQGFLSMSVNLWSISLIIVLCAILALFMYLVFTARYPQVSKRSILVGMLCCLPFFVLNCLLMNWHFGMAQTWYTSFVISTVQSSTRMNGVYQAFRNEDLPLVRIKDNAPDVIIVLGESASSKDWHLYGYPRLTTPYMDELSAAGKLVTYRDVVGVHPDTVGALSLLLTDVSFDNLETGNWTLAGVYAKAGYRCVLISQQYSVTDRTSTLCRIFNGCEKRLSVFHENGDVKAFDEKTIPLLEGELNAIDDRPNLIFIHLAGMHYPVQNVIPDGEAYFSDDVDADVLQGKDAGMRDRINRYDNAIRYEDKVLGGIIDVLAKRKRAIAFFFISDHGESPRAEGWRDFHDEDVYCLPAIFWFSDEYRKMFPERVLAFEKVAQRPIQSDEMTHGLLELGCIQSKFSHDSKVNFLCEGFKGRHPRLIDKGRIKLKRDME